MVSGSVNFRTPAVRPCSDPLRSYLRCRRTSVGNTLPMTTKRTCMQRNTLCVHTHSDAPPSSREEACSSQHGVFLSSARALRQILKRLLRQEPEILIWQGMMDNTPGQRKIERSTMSSTGSQGLKARPAKEALEQRKGETYTAGRARPRFRLYFEGSCSKGNLPSSVGQAGMRGALPWTGSPGA